MNARGIVITLMLAMVVFESGAAAEPQDDPLSVSRVSLPRRSLSAIAVDVHEALRAEALKRRRGPNAPEVIRLVDLYRELAAHPRRYESAVIAELGLKLQSRLKKVREIIERQGAQPARHAKRRLVSSTLVMPQTQVLAQQVAVPGGAAPGPGAQPAAAQAGAAPTIDYGPELVELIQQTISPATWDINGGNGSVVYFSPLRAIVVSAPGTVHGRVADVLGQLRAAP